MLLDLLLLKEPLIHLQLLRALGLDLQILPLLPLLVRDPRIGLRRRRRNLRERERWREYEHDGGECPHCLQVWLERVLRKRR